MKRKNEFRDATTLDADDNESGRSLRSRASVEVSVVWTAAAVRGYG
jgi:hypothetical protein